MTATRHTPDVHAQDQVVPVVPDDLLRRLEHATQSMVALTALVAQAQPAVAIIVDSADELVRRARDRGIDVDARLHATLHLVDRLTAPDSMRVLHMLLDRLPMLEQAIVAAGRLPGAVAIGVDSLDEFMHDVQATTPPAPLGLFGMIRALRDPDVQRTIGVLLRGAARVGRTLNRSPQRSSSPTAPQRG